MRTPNRGTAAGNSKAICAQECPFLRSSATRSRRNTYRELAEVVIVERALGVGRLLERESLRHFDVEGAGLDQAINLLERRILILSVIRLHGDAGTIFLRQLNTVRIGGSSTATQRCYAFLRARPSGCQQHRVNPLRSELARGGHNIF